MVTRVLLFEDESEIVTPLVEMLAKQAPDKEKFEIVWFRQGFDPPAGRPIYPVQVENDFGPTLLHVEKSNIRRQDDGVSLVWWPSQFDAAILDIFVEQSDRPVGYRYAELFERADFSGPVAMISRRSRETREFQLDLRRLHKEDQDWQQHAVDHALKSLRSSREQRAKGHIRRHRVNYLGREPSTFLRDFHEFGGNAVHERQPWLSAYFGNDERLSRKLAQFFDLPPYRKQSTYRIEDLQEVLVDAEQQGGKKPKVIWIDCLERGNRLTDELVEQLAVAFRERASNPIGFFLADTDSLVSKRKLLFQSNGVLVCRRELDDSPSMWAGTSIERLATSYEQFRENALRQHGKVENLLGGQNWSDSILDAGFRVVEALLPPFMMARSTARLVGTTNFPSLAAWTSHRAGGQLKGPFVRLMNAILRALHENGRVSDQQLKLFLHASNDEARLTKKAGASIGGSKRK